MNIDNKLDLLKQIQEVDAPPYLLTRIRQQLQNLDNIEAPVKWKWTFAFSSVVILALNLSVFFKQVDVSREDNTGIETVVNSMNLVTTNNIYNE